MRRISVLFFFSLFAPIFGRAQAFGLSAHTTIGITGGARESFITVPAPSLFFYSYSATTTSAGRLGSVTGYSRAVPEVGALADLLHRDFRLILARLTEKYGSFSAFSLSGPVTQLSDDDLALLRDVRIEWLCGADRSDGLAAVVLEKLPPLQHAPWGYSLTYSFISSRDTTNLYRGL